MNRSLLIAVRECRQIAATRGFWVLLLTVPLALIVGQAAGKFLKPPSDLAYVIVDVSGVAAPNIDHRFELDHQRSVLAKLSEYGAREKLGPLEPQAVWATGRSWFTDADAEAFLAAGGLDAALRDLGPRMPKATPPFEAPSRRAVRVAPPVGAPVDRGAEAFGAAIAAIQKADVETSDGKRPLALVA